MAKKKSKKNGNIISVDFTDVKGSNKLPEGDYQVRIKEIEAKESSKGNPMLNFTLEVSEGKHSGKVLYHNCSLQPQALFNLRNLLEAAGYGIEQGAFDIDLDELVGLELGVTVEHEEYQGSTKNRIVDTFSLDELEDDGEDEEEEETEDEEESEDEEEEETSFEDMEDEELIEAAAEAEIEVPYTGKGKKKKLDRKALIELLEAAGEESDEEEEDDDSDDEDENDEDDEEIEEYTKEDLEEMDEEALIDAAGEVGAEPVYTGKGKKKKLSVKKTIAAILEAQDEEDEEDED